MKEYSIFVALKSVSLPLLSSRSHLWPDFYHGSHLASCRILHKQNWHYKEKQEMWCFTWQGFVWLVLLWFFLWLICWLYWGFRVDTLRTSTQLWPTSSPLFLLRDYRSLSNPGWPWTQDSKVSDYKPRATRPPSEAFKKNSFFFFLFIVK